MKHFGEQILGSISGLYTSTAHAVLRLAVFWGLCTANAAHARSISGFDTYGEYSLHILEVFWGSNSVYCLYLEYFGILYESAAHSFEDLQYFCCWYCSRQYFEYSQYSRTSCCEVQ